MFFSRKHLDKESKNHFLAPLCRDLDKHCQKGLYRDNFSLYNSTTGRQQEFALFITKDNDGVYRFSGFIVELYKYRNPSSSDYKTWFSDLEPINPNIRETDAGFTLKLWNEKLKPVSELFEVRYVDGHLTTEFMNLDNRLSTELLTLFIQYNVGGLPFSEYLQLTQSLLSKENFLINSTNTRIKRFWISRGDTKDLEEGQAFYSIRQNGVLFEVVELNPTYLYFGYYDLDAKRRHSKNLVCAYIDEEQAIYDLNHRVRSENIRPDQRISY